MLREKGIITSASLGSGYVSVCNASDLVDELTDRLVANPSFGLRVGKGGMTLGFAFPNEHYMNSVNVTEVICAQACY